MSSQTPETANIKHLRIYVYENAAPPLGQPVAISLCPNRRGAPRTLVGSTSQVTCTVCLKHINELGLDWIE
jgi:hypothetical protein